MSTPIASPNHHRSQADPYESSVAPASVTTVTPFVALIAVLASAPPTTRASTERTRSSAMLKPSMRTRKAPATAASVLPTVMPAATPTEASSVALATNAPSATAGQ